MTTKRNGHSAFSRTRIRNLYVGGAQHSLNIANTDCAVETLQGGCLSEFSTTVLGQQVFRAVCNEYYILYLERSIERLTTATLFLTTAEDFSEINNLLVIVCLVLHKDDIGFFCISCTTNTFQDTWMH